MLRIRLHLRRNELGLHLCHRHLFRLNFIDWSDLFAHINKLVLDKQHRLLLLLRLFLFLLIGLLIVFLRDVIGYFICPCARLADFIRDLVDVCLLHIMIVGLLGDFGFSSSRLSPTFGFNFVLILSFK